MEAYKSSTDIWGTYGTIKAIDEEEIAAIKQEIDNAIEEANGIQPVFETISHSPHNCYDLMGRYRSNLSTGLNIIGNDSKKIVYISNR